MHQKRISRQKPFFTFSREANKKYINYCIFLIIFALFFFVTFPPLRMNIPFHLGKQLDSPTDTVECEKDLGTLSSRLGAPDFDANNPSSSHD